MKQIEFDAAMQQMNYDQMVANQQYNADKEELDKEINDRKLSILQLRSEIQALHIRKLALQSEQKKMNQERHAQKHQFVIDHPRTSMEDYMPSAQGHAIQEEAV